jgi:hypothetical protein
VAIPSVTSVDGNNEAAARLTWLWPQSREVTRPAVRGLSTVSSARKTRQTAHPLGAGGRCLHHCVYLPPAKRGVNTHNPCCDVARPRFPRAYSPECLQLSAYSCVVTALTSV